MKEEIPKLKQMMKDLTDLKDKVQSQGNKGKIGGIIVEIKELCELLDF